MVTAGQTEPRSKGRKRPPRTQGPSLPGSNGWDSASDGVVLCTPDGRIVQANKAAADLDGIAALCALAHGDLSSWPARFDLRSVDGSPLTPQQLPGERALRGEQTVPVEALVRDRATGAEHRLLMTARPVFGTDGSVACAVALFRDITAHSRTARAMAAARAGLDARTTEHAAALAAALDELGDRMRWHALHKPGDTSTPRDPKAFHAALNATPDAMLLVDAAGIIRSANPASARLFGWSCEELIGASVDTLVPARLRDLHAHHRAGFQRHPATRQMGERGAMRAVRRDGTEFPVDICLSPFEEADGTQVLATIRDLSTSKLAEGRWHSLIRTEAALVHGGCPHRSPGVEPSWLAETLAHSGDGTIVVDTDGRVRMLNRIAEYLTGWSTSEAVGQPIANVFAILETPDGPVSDDPIAYILNKSAAEGRQEPALLISRTGAKHAICECVALVLDRASAPKSVVLVFHDVTAREWLEEEVSRAARLEPLGVLAGGIAHDFNNVLTGVLANLSLALELLPPGAEVRPFLVDAEAAARRTASLTAQLLAFAKGGVPVRKPVQLQLTIRAATQLALDGLPVRARFEVAEDLWPVEADVVQIGQVVHQLALNAAQAMPHGGDLVVAAENALAKLATSHEVPARCVCIRVSDTGVGIASSVLPRIFDPYFTTKAKRSGLGLAMVHRVVTKHDGRVEVRSTPEKGTTFSVYLPASEVPVKTAQRSREVAWRTARVLLMDDDEGMRAAARAVLTTRGYAFDLARDGADALERFRAARLEGHPFEVIILDLTVPGGMGGVEALAHLCALDPATRAIASSGYSYDPVMASPCEHGFSGTLVKPYTASEMDDAIQDVLAGGEGGCGMLVRRKGPAA